MCLHSLPLYLPHPHFPLQNWHLRTEQRDEGEGEVKREGEKRREVGWQAADPIALPSDSVYLPVAPWGFVSEDSAMMNRPV